LANALFQAEVALPKALTFEASRAERSTRRARSCSLARR
jgi:hypothetical protein